MPDVLPQGLPFEEAADYFRQKVDLPTETWTDLREDMHARAFVVAGAKKAALLADFREALQAALDDGETLADFRKRFDDMVARHGWSYKGGRGWRTRVIYDTNLRMAQSAGRWQQIMRRAAAAEAQGQVVYIRYLAILDSRTRPAHKGWNDVVLPSDHPFWRTHYPPNGWRCRCSVQILTERQLARYGIKVTEQPPPVEMQPRTVNTPSGPVSWPTPAGIDTGFGYNVGRAAWGSRMDAQVMAGWKEGGKDAFEPLTPPGAPPMKGLAPAPAPAAPLPAALPPDRLATVQGVLGGPEKIVKAPDGARVSLTAQALADTLPDERLRVLPLVEDVVADPGETWFSFERHKETGKVRLRRRQVKAFELPDGATVEVGVQLVDGRLEWVLLGDDEIAAARSGILLQGVSRAK